MPSKYKITGFARLLLFLVILTPIAYIGASYYNGEDGIAKIKDLIGLNKTNSAPSNDDLANMTSDELLRLKDQEIRDLKSQNTKLQRLLADCKN